MVSGMLDGVIKQMVDKFPNANTDSLMASMKGQPQAGQLFGLMKSIGISEDKLRQMIDVMVASRQKG